jgi:hypothetical protein
MVAKLPAMLNDNDRRLLADVEKYGWHCVQVAGDAEGPTYSFTVGLFQTYQHPELLIMGLDAEVAHGVLSVAVQNIAKGHRYREGQRDDSLIENGFCHLKGIPSRLHRQYMGYAVWFYRNSPSPFTALQVIWPDSEGRFAGEAGFLHPELQPEL